MPGHVIAPVSDIPPGSRKLVTVGRRDIVVFNLSGEFFALANTCPHLGGSLFHGIQTARVESPEPGVYATSTPGEIVKCPWHGWGFEVRTGQSWCDPEIVSVRKYKASICSGATLADDTPRVAETFSVRVEDDYVVVDI